MNESGEPKVTVVVVAQRERDETVRCLGFAVKGSAGIPHRIVVVDDGTPDRIGDALGSVANITAIRTEIPRGLASGMNAGARLATTPLVAFLHGDAEAHPGWLAPLVKTAEASDEVAAVVSRLLAPNGLIDSDGVNLAVDSLTPVPVHRGEPAIPEEDVAEVATGSAVALMVRREAFLKAGGFDPDLVGSAADLDLCLRLRENGGRILLARASVAVHYARCRSALSGFERERVASRWLPERLSKALAGVTFGPRDQVLASFCTCESPVRRV